ncbi:MAG TPA: hypothetical protein PLV68_12305, partial [Ilumatobacteraceae bacterium]|nr:hypothetical protein [Ilumatobacteraceae bacterium]
TIAYLDAENAYADAWFAQHEATVETVFAEIKSRVRETDAAAPVRKGDWWYTTRMVEGQSYAIHCRGRSRDTAEDTVLIDENELAAGHDFFDMGVFDVSPDHALAAWSGDTDGGERYVMRIRDLATGADLGDELANTSWGGSAWVADASHLFYVQSDEAMRPYQVWRHRLGTPQTDDVMVFEEPDERFFVSVDLTRSGEWVVIDVGSKTSSEVRLIRATDPTAEPTL